MADKDRNMIKIECMSDGMSADRNGIVTARFKAPYGEIGDWLKLFGVIGLDLIFATKGEDEGKFFRTGKARFKKVSADKEGEAQIHLYGDEIDVARLQSLKEQAITLAVKIDPDGVSDG